MDLIFFVRVRMDLIYCVQVGQIEESVATLSSTLEEAQKVHSDLLQVIFILSYFILYHQINLHPPYCLFVDDIFQKQENIALFKVKQSLEHDIFIKTNSLVIDR